MNIKHTISIIVSCLLLTLFGCSQERNLNPDDIKGDANRIRLTTYAPSADSSLKAALIENEGTLDLQVRFRKNDKVNLYALQNDIITEIGEVGFKELAEDGSKATIDFTLPNSIDVAKPMTLIGYSGLNQRKITLKDNKLEVIATNNNSNSQQRFNAPVIFRLKNFTPAEASVADMSVTFEHIGAYEIVHFTNTSTEEVTADYVGLSSPSAYAIERPWSYTDGYDRSVGKSLYPYYNLVDGTIAMKPDRSLGDYTIAPKVPSGATVSVFSWFIPKDMPRPEMVLSFRDAKTNGYLKSQETIPASNEHIKVGKAYHAYGTWDGTKLTLTDSKGELKPKPYIKVTTGIPVGKMIGVKAYVSYGNRQSAFVDLNGNGIKDGALESAPTSSWKAQPYEVQQPEITFYGKFETLNLEKQQISSVIVSPVATPYEINLKDNNLSAEALNKLFESLPDINHLEVSTLVSKKLSIDKNPGIDGCNAKVAIDKGWILDISIIDNAKPHVAFAMSSYTSNHNLYLKLGAADEDKDNIWIDLNGDGVMSDNEKIPAEAINSNNYYKIAWEKDELYLYGNVTKIDASGNGNITIFSTENNTTLKHLNLADNGLWVALLRKCTDLEYLNLSGNTLYVTPELPLTIDHLTALKALDLSNCGIDKVDVSKMKDLTYINVEGNKLESIDLMNKPNLRTIIATSNQLKRFDFDSKIVRHIEVGGNALDKNALLSLFNLLPDRTAESIPGGLWITNNPGVSEVSVKPALDKNWNVDTKNLKAGNTGKRGDMDGEDW